MRYALGLVERRFIGYTPLGINQEWSARIALGARMEDVNQRAFVTPQQPE